ncbi:MAG: SDR family NAD(P)-dependent oxidoreductase [[Clostridium] fimetarium]|nr:SDR family NAD(P)-dependent oxidoreductase [Alistipes timonensis]MCM1406358.1 SDR family NAD(P)-dependent oxidoreductase [[Clostridium] fimetarium]
MRRFIIVGASSGIGAYCARSLAEAGYPVGAAARDTAKLEALRREFPQMVVTESIDITSPDAPEALNRLIAKLGGMDVYFHVAGIGYDNDAFAEEPDLRTAATNVGGFTRMVDAAWRYFAERGGEGQIAAITSVAGTRGIGTLASYSASKAYQQHYLEAMRQRAHALNYPLTITDIRPGWVLTPLLPGKPSDYPLAMTMERAGRLIVKALLSRRTVVTVDWRWRTLCALWRHLPRFIWTRLPLPHFPLGVK